MSLKNRSRSMKIGQVPYIWIYSIHEFFERLPLRNRPWWVFHQEKITLGGNTLLLTPQTHTQNPQIHFKIWHWAYFSRSFGPSKLKIMPYFKKSEKYLLFKLRIWIIFLRHTNYCNLHILRNYLDLSNIRFVEKIINPIFVIT